MRPYVRLSPAAQSHVLAHVLERCRARGQGGAPVVVFDLDGTLFDNRPRTLRILHELASVWDAREPEGAAKLRAATLLQLEYLLTASLANLGVTATHLVAEAELFWRERFFVDDYLEHDEPIAGAVDFAVACYDAGGLLVYFTGRDLPLMGAGTFASLRDHGFPIGVVGTELVLKPDAAMPDEAFKRLEGPELARLGVVAGLFDNEPVNCNVLSAHYPAAETCLVDTQHLPGAPLPDKGVHIIADFQRVE